MKYGNITSQLAHATAPCGVREYKSACTAAASPARCRQSTTSPITSQTAVVNMILRSSVPLHELSNHLRHTRMEDIRSFRIPPRRHEGLEEIFLTGLTGSTGKT